MTADCQCKCGKLRWVFIWSAVAALFVYTLVAGGCAAGRTAYGGTVVGFEVGAIQPESIAEVAGYGASFLPPPWGTVATGAIGVLTAGGFGAAAAAKARRQGERDGWDEPAEAAKAGEPV